MMKQFTELQRYELQAYLQAGIKKDEIAHKLGVHRSSLYRELRRNKWNPSDVYDAAYAQYRYELRKEQRVHSKKFTTYMEARAETMLVQLDYSPDKGQSYIAFPESLLLFFHSYPPYVYFHPAGR